MNRWYVVYTQANAELKALNNLVRQGFTAYLPQFKKIRRHARKSEMVLRPLFPRYLFVAFDVERDRWRSILSTYGVANIVGNRSCPEAVPDALVEMLQAHKNDAGSIHPLRLRGIAEGTSVQIEEGIFAGSAATLAEMQDEDRVTVLMNIFGRETSINLPLEAISVA